METNLMPMLTDVGFPIGLCLILLYGFKKVGEVLLARVVDPVAPRTESSSRSLSNSLSFKGNWCERWFLFRNRYCGSWSRLRLPMPGVAQDLGGGSSFGCCVRAT